jgi:hypothetical protein
MFGAAARDILVNMSTALDYPPYFFRGHRTKLCLLQLAITQLQGYCQRQMNQSPKK